MSNRMNFLDETPFWVEFPESRKVPKGAMVAGYYNGTPLYIGRAVHEGAMTPGEFDFIFSNNSAMTNDTSLFRLCIRC